MKHIDVEDFTAHSDRCVRDGVALQVRQGGRTIGYYLPALPTSAQERQQAVADWGRTVEGLRATMGMTEDELVDFFDPAKPLPRELEPAEPATHAPSR